ncbi:MAG: hypothetical protein EOR08_22495 [Mesorhizobium sp.]|nr:MAG: hypothetical protein EOR08_22495 [Mesorhizobium sp.]
MVSLPLPPPMVSLPPSPDRWLLPALPVRVLARALPMPSILAVPVKVSLSMSPRACAVSDKL